MNINDIAKRLGIGSSSVVSKAQELLRRANAKAPAGMGEADLCKPAICLELACSQMGTAVKREDLLRCSCCTAKMYQSTFLSLQKLLCISVKADARELVVQHGCMRLEPAIKRVLLSYKERFLKSLPAAARYHADFSRPVFTTVAFYLVARKNKVRVDRNQLMTQYSINSDDFNKTYASMYDLCFDQVGIEKRKRSERKTNTELVHRHSESKAEGEGDNDDDEDNDDAEYDEDMPHMSERQKNKKEFKEWKSRVLSSERVKVDVKRLKQATLSFGTAKR